MMDVMTGPFFGVCTGRMVRALVKPMEVGASMCVAGRDTYQNRMGQSTVVPPKGE